MGSRRGLNEIMNLPKMDLWKLRSDAVNKNEYISKEQLGRILFMMNQKRGYKSARSEQNLDKKDTDSSSDKFFEAYSHVRIFSDSLQAVGDSLFYSLKDSVFRLFKSPVTWSQENQLTGDTIYLYLKNKQPAVPIKPLRPQILVALPHTNCRAEYCNHGL